MSDDSSDGEMIAELPKTGESAPWPKTPKLWGSMSTSAETRMVLHVAAKPVDAKRRKTQLHEYFKHGTDEPATKEDTVVDIVCKHCGFRHVGLERRSSQLSKVQQQMTRCKKTPCKAV